MTSSTRTAATSSIISGVTEESNPCQQVRQSCLAFVSSAACCVHVDRPSLQALATEIRKSARDRGPSIVWDEEGWHYQLDTTQEKAWGSAVCRERVAAYILALDAINFCFWPADESSDCKDYEYQDLAITLTSCAKADHEVQQSLADQGLIGAISTDFVFSAKRMQAITVDEMRALLARHHPQQWVPPDLERRCQLWNEVGTVLNQKCGGSASFLVDAACGSAPALVQLLVENFPGFQDRSNTTSYSTSTTSSSSTSDPQEQPTPQILHFYKRAQICVGDWNAALQLRLNYMEQLTTFADYRVPQLLRHCNILNYHTKLANTVDAKEELPKDSVQEHSIRAATVVAVEYLVEQLNTECGDSRSEPWTAVTADWYLWQVGEKRNAKGELEPHHRVRTIYY